MASSEPPHMDEIIYEPDYFSNGDLLRMSVSQLSRVLAPSLLGNAILPVYIRWLCLHRDYPSTTTVQWLNISQQWVQALRARGCRAIEMDYALESRRQEYLAAMKNPWSAYASRPLPSPADIMRWFDNTGVEGYRMNSRDYREGDYSRAPPGDYVCNRCGKKGMFDTLTSIFSSGSKDRGHHLQICPTNLDPAYDKPPGDSYTCTVCFRKGAHYQSLCPKNRDPYSLTQQRKENGIRSEPDYEAYERQPEADGRTPSGFEDLIDFEPVVSRDARVRDPECAMSFDHEAGYMKTPHEHGGDHMEGTGPAKRTLDRGIADTREKKRGRRLTCTSGRSSNDGSPTPDRKESLRKRIRRIEDYEGKLVDGKALASTHIDLIRKKAVTQKELDVLDQDKPGVIDIGYEDDNPMALRLHRPSVSSDGSGRVSLDSMSFDQPKTPVGFAPIPARSAFIQKLMQLRTKQMTEVVNVHKQRPTAISMWQLDGQIKIMQAPETTPHALADPFWDGGSREQYVEKPTRGYWSYGRPIQHVVIKKERDIHLKEPQRLINQASPTLAVNDEITEDLDRFKISSTTQQPKCVLNDMTNSAKEVLSKRGDPFAAVYQMALPH